MSATLRPCRRFFLSPPILAIFFLLLAMALLAPGTGWGQDSPLPTDWNPANLARIKAPSSGDLTFAVLGDSRDNPQLFARLVKQMSNDRDIAFAVHLGDMVNSSDPEQYRRFFFAPLQGNLRIPMVTVMGNHELHKKGAELYTRIFGPRYYSFQVKDHYFIILDDAEKGAPDEAQLRWLAGELQKAQSFKTRLVFMHIPFCDPRGGGKYCLTGPAAGQLEELCKKFKVTHVFAGHIHAYYSREWSGIPHTITGGAGAKLYRENPLQAFFHYLKVTIRGSRVNIRVERLAAPEGSELRPRPYSPMAWMGSKRPYAE